MHEILNKSWITIFSFNTPQHLQSVLVKSKFSISSIIYKFNDMMMTNIWAINENDITAWKGK